MKIFALSTLLVFTACSKDGDEQHKGEDQVGESNKKSVSEDARRGSIEMTAEDDIGEVLATVDGNPIGSKDFIQRAVRKQPADGKALSQKERQEILDEMIEDELVFLQAFEKKLYRDPKVKKVMINALMRDEVYSQIKKGDFNEDDIKNYYESNKEEFTIPEKAQFSRILIKITRDRDEAAAKAEAERISKELSRNGSPENFKSMAEKLSDGPYKRRGGEVGFVSRKGKPGIDEEVVDRIFNMGKGQISKVFQTKAGFNIVMLKERRNAQERPFSQMKGTVLRKLKNEKLKELFAEYREQIKQGKDILIDDEKLNALELKSKKRALRASDLQRGHKD